jgi:hypothetical protein
VLNALRRPGTILNMELEGKLVLLENGTWARYRAVPLHDGSGMRVVVAVELTPEERERVSRETRAVTLH